MIAYLLTVALHAMILSVFASAILLVVRQARYRAVIALCGLLALAILPWFTALRSSPVADVASAKNSAAPAPAALPVWTVVTLPMETPVTASAVRKAVDPAGFAFPDPLKSALALWAVGTVAGCILLGCAWLRQRRWMRSLDAIDDVSWEKLQATDAALPPRSRFRLTSATASPCVSGLRHPCVVLPRFLFADDAVTALGWAVRHELSHLRAGDSRWIFVLALVRCFHWWNPLSHHLVSRWAAAREQLCDLAAAEIPASRNGYGHFLVTMAGKLHRPSPLTVAMARRAPARRLRSRIISLLGAQPGAEKPVGKQFISLSLVGFVSVGVMVSVLGIRAEDAALEFGPAVQSPVQETQSKAPPEPKPLSTPMPEEAPAPNAAVDKSGVIQIKTSTQFVATREKNFPLDQALFSESQQRMLMRSLAQAKGTYLMTAPRLTSRSGQKGTVENIRKVMGTSEQSSSRNPDSIIPFVGIALDFKTTLLEGGLAELDLKVSYRYIPNVFQPVFETSPYEALPARTNPDEIKILDRKASMRLESRMAIGINLGEIEPGLFLYMLAKVESIDENGRPTVGFADDTLLPEERRERKSQAPVIYPSAFSRPAVISSAGPQPSAEVHGSLRVSGEIVEFPRHEGGPIPPEPMVQLVPTTPEIARAILSQAGAKVSELKEVEVPLNQAATPWPEFPGLMVSAMASSDFKRLTISSLPVGDDDNIEGLSNMWPSLPSGCVMNFSMKSQDPSMERRLLIRIDALK